MKFYKPEIEMVKKLKFLSPEKSLRNLNNIALFPPFTPNIRKDESVLNRNIIFM